MILFVVPIFFIYVGNERHFQIEKREHTFKHKIFFFRISKTQNDIDRALK